MSKKPLYTEIDGLLLPPSFLPEIFRAACAFKPGPDDVIVATYPKCGTTWTQQIVALILRKGKPFLEANKYFATLPFLEMTTEEELSGLEKPRCIKTHLPFDRINFSKEAKYIYVVRHPIDCVVSFFHHARFFPIYFFSDGEFDDFFELFIKGEVDWNDYFDHLLLWYEHRNEPNILFLCYESMIKDPRSTCLKIAHFLGDSYYNTLVENDEEVLKKVLEYSSLKFMKSTVNEFWKEHFSHIPSEEAQKKNPVLKKYSELLEKAFKDGHTANGSFIRKGVVGEGKITLSEKQLQKLNDRILEKTKHSDVMDLWK
ncbi:sulfotransferase 1C4 [Nephila pilipes]|uniref:Sulfotransferase 1C4 n=1 Tax=Nephila pilipes TaxID=299642 RepID=A0A8X6UA27_NEPPI|nr:sulfotransferase 1C4 [Nephila pilipes]